MITNNRNKRLRDIGATKKPAGEGGLLWLKHFGLLVTIAEQSDF
jgi:hypothetical protein